MRLLIDLFGVGRLSSESLGCCGEAPEREERDALLVRRGEEADWRRAKDDEGLRAEVGVGGACGDVGEGRAAVLARRSCERDMRFIVLFRSCGSVLVVACEATDGDRVEAGDFGGKSMLAVSRSRRDLFQEKNFSQSVCALCREGGVCCVCPQNSDVCRVECKDRVQTFARLSISPASRPPSQSNHTRGNFKHLRRRRGRKAG